MAPFIKHLPCEHENLNLNPKINQTEPTFKKSGEMVSVYKPHAGERKEQAHPWSSLANNLAG